MKTDQTLKLSRGLIAALGGFALFTRALQAAPFLYSSGDLVLAVRRTGNASDLVVNIGKSTNYSTLPAGVTLVVSNLSIAQLNSTFPTANGLSWSVAAASRPPGVGSFPLQTLWVTAPRVDVNTPGAAWLRKGQFTQGNAAAQIDVIGLSAASYSSSQSSNANNTVTGVVIPTSSSDYALLPVIGDSGNYVGTFQGNVENLTPDDFDGDPANVTRSDLYELIPVLVRKYTLNAAGRYIGYFEFKPDGSLTFNTIVPPPPQPLITEITRGGNVTTVSFTTVTNVTYQLRINADLTAPVSTWAIGSSISGNGSVLSLQDTNAAVVRFFAIEAQSQ